ncbi:sulfatase-like hydrolase/transferase [Halogranum rubrum]|uniref:Sulfatase n=1 Tax=Halogranum salarium B-1 TaxID=1210908 RepID=J3ETY4_9EURY|nr:sulfatase-like hydrolase/transferase [Halogranum salarium]EJN57692.1 sulfatase [Halogranum salarium B-1]
MVDKPNVLLVQTDQQRWDTLGTYGNPMGLTPTLDQMAANGVKVERAFSPQPLCGPSRAALQTGQYASRSSVMRDSKPLPADAKTLAHAFGDAGYDTGFVGDWHLAGTFDEAVSPKRRHGYEDFWIAADVPEFTTQPTEGTLYDGYGEPREFSTYRTDAFTDFALEAIGELSEPFLLVVSYLEPHDQNELGRFVGPTGAADRHATNPYIPRDLAGRPGDWYAELPDYYAMVERIDECVRRLFDALNEQTYRESVRCFTSDHGCHFKTRPGEYKRSCHESSIRVPLLFDGLGFEREGHVEELVSLIDVAPTLLDAAGIDVPVEMDGKSILSLVDGSAETWREAIFVQTGEAEIGRSIRTDRWKLGVAAPTMNGWRGGWGDDSSDVYVDRYLYDLATDPEEHVNLVGRADSRAVADELRERLTAFITDVESETPELHSFENPGYREL